jgi:hypothetical protein
MEMVPFGQFNNHHYTEEYTPAWGALVPTNDLISRRYAPPAYHYVKVLIFISRCFRNAIRFSQHLPYLNPVCTSLELVMREGDRIVLANTENCCQMAVFLTTGIVSQCQIVNPGWTSSSNATQIRRIALCPFTTKYQRTVSMIGNALQLGEEVDSFLGPLSDGNMTFGMCPQNNGSLASKSNPIFPPHLFLISSRSQAIHTLSPW